MRLLGETTVIDACVAGSKLSQPSRTASSWSSGWHDGGPFESKYNQTGTPFFVDSTMALSCIARRLIGRHRKPVERLLSTQFSHENCGFSSTRSRSVNE